MKNVRFFSYLSLLAVATALVVNACMAEVDAGAVEEEALKSPTAVASPCVAGELEERAKGDERTREDALKDQEATLENELYRESTGQDP